MEDHDLKSQEYRRALERLDYLRITGCVPRCIECNGYRHTVETSTGEVAEKCPCECHKEKSR